MGWLFECDVAPPADRVREGPGIQLADCWAHIRRKFAEAEPNYPEAREMLDLIRQMYDIDARAETEEQLAMLRATESCDVLSQMRTWLGSVHDFIH